MSCARSLAGGLYALSRRRPSARQAADAAISKQIRAIYAASRSTYGSPRVHRALRRDDVRVRRKRVERIMRRDGLRGRIRRRFRRTTDSNHTLPVPPRVTAATTQGRNPGRAQRRSKGVRVVASDVHLVEDLPYAESVLGRTLIQGRERLGSHLSSGSSRAPLDSGDADGVHSE